MTSPTPLPPAPATGRPNASHPHGGWPLLGAIGATLLLMAAAVLWMQPDVQGLRMLIRLTARTSLVLFLLAFTASSAARLWPNAWTRWQLRQRRYFGLGFALSHAIHGAAIVSFAQLDSVGFHQASNLGNIISGGIAYVFIALMAATSFDGARRWLGARAWGWLHTLGAHYIWISFMVTFGKRIPMSPYYALPVLVLLAAMGLRLRSKPASSASKPNNRPPMDT